MDEKVKLRPFRLDRLARINLLFLLGIYLLNTWIAEATAITTFIAYIPAVIWILPTVVLFFLCFRATGKIKKRAFWDVFISALSCLLLMGFTIPSFFSEVEGHEVTLLTFNIKHAPQGWASVQKIVAEKNPDIICFQEANGYSERGSIQDKLPNYQVVEQGGLAIASKIGIKDAKRVPLPPGPLDAFEATCGEVKVVNVQLASYSVEKVGARNPFTLPGHLHTLAGVHQKQVDALVREYGKQKDCVLTGDFNGPPRGRVYRTLTRSFEDVFAQKGWGFGYTYPSTIPLLRIDYAFTTDLKPLSAEVVATTLSDHRPVFFKLLVYRPT